VGAALLGAVLFVAHFLGRAFGTDLLLRWVPLAIDVLMVVLGAEILLNFVLNLYRPRRAGEWLRPAFDSRVLAFLAAPDRLAASISDAVNYQFGFDVSSTWFYRLVSRSMLGLVLLSAATLWVMTAFAVVGPDERALVLRGGGVVREAGSGLVIKRPWPLDRLVRFPASSVSQFTVGSLSLSQAAQENKGPILWTNAGSEGDKYMIVRAGGGSSSLALMSMEAPVHYRVRDLEQYLNLAQDGPASDRERVRRDVLRAKAARALVISMAGFTVDQLLGPDRAEAVRALSAAVQSSFDEINAGVEVVFVGLQGVQPARDVAESFETVVGSDYKRDAAIAQAEAEAIQVLSRVAGDLGLARTITAELDALEKLKATGADEDAIGAKERAIVDLIVEAGGQAAVDIARARGDRWSRAMGQRARSALSAGQIESFRAAPEAYIMGLYMDALRDSMAQARVWISPFDDPAVVLNQEEISAALQGIGENTNEGEE
jgi:regulator of protease activity HflC (stomatin/prohibitin superfamily)